MKTPFCTSVAFALLALAVPATAVNGDDPGGAGGNGLALRTRKALVCEYGGASAVDNAVILVKDGRIGAVGLAHEVEIPEGYEVIDLGDLWVAPGLIDLHCHVAGGIRDLNDMLFLTNPGLRASTAVTPGNSNMKAGVAGGVTAALLIPGSGTNMGGQGILLRSGFDTYDENLIRQNGSLKLAQAGNPERRAPWNPSRTLMNWNTRYTFRRGLAYAKRMKQTDSRDAQTSIDPQWEIFRDLLDKKTQVSTHTQMYQVVLKTVTMVRQEMGLDVYIDHGTFDGFRAAAIAEAAGVQAILGPRQIQGHRTGFIDTDGRIQGVAAGYQERGHTMVGFNTDAVGRGSGIAQEDLTTQAAMGVHYGFDNSKMDGLRGITIVPAMSSGIAGRMGSIEVGKDADLIIVTGDPLDSRTSVEMVFQLGRKVYDTSEDIRRW